jgi:SnoaL-like domain
VTEDDSAVVAEIRDRQQIEAVLHRYCRGVDRKDFDLMRSAYHNDAEDLHGGYNGDVDGLIAWVRDRHEAVDQSMHFLGSRSIEFDGERAFGETYCIVHQRVRGGDGQRPVRLTVGCRYLDRFERREGKWAIAKRVVAYEWWREESCDAERGFGPEWTVSEHSRDDALYRLRAEVPI